MAKHKTHAGSRAGGTLIRDGSFSAASKNWRIAFARSLTGYSHLHQQWRWCKKQGVHCWMHGPAASGGCSSTQNTHSLHCAEQCGGGSALQQQRCSINSSSPTASSSILAALAAKPGAHQSSQAGCSGSARKVSISAIIPGWSGLVRCRMLQRTWQGCGALLDALPAAQNAGLPQERPAGQMPGMHRHPGT